jgi:hypothetical protein
MKLKEKSKFVKIACTQARCEIVQRIRPKIYMKNQKVLKEKRIARKAF